MTDEKMGALERLAKLAQAEENRRRDVGVTVRFLELIAPWLNRNAVLEENVHDEVRTVLGEFDNAELDKLVISFTNTHDQVCCILSTLKKELDNRQAEHEPTDLMTMLRAVFGDDVQVISMDEMTAPPSMLNPEAN